MKRILHVLLFALPCTFTALAPAQAPRLSNLSVRAQSGTGGDLLITGFTISAGANKTVLIRAIGPTLEAFGISEFLADPKLALHAGEQQIAENDNWGTGDAVTFASVGAFTLAPGSRDAALVATLAPGSYTAQVTPAGASSSAGTVLVEIYEVTGGAARLINLSTRAQVGTGSNILIPGLTISSGSGIRRLLVRAVGPTLGTFGVPGVLADPKLELFSTARLAENDNWETPTSSSAANAAELRAAATQVGAFPLAAGSRDAALLTNLAAGSYTLQVSGVGNATGVALVEAYDLTPNVPAVSVAATVSVTDTRGGAPALITLTRTGGTAEPLTVHYAIAGSARSGTDYLVLPGSVTIPAGASSATVKIEAVRQTAATSDKVATLFLTPADNYTAEPPNSATVAIFGRTPAFHYTSLRPPVTARTTAHGTASIQLSVDGSFALVSANLSNLSSSQTVAYVRLGNPGETGTELFRLPPGQLRNVYWPITATATHSAADIVDALRNGRVFVNFETANFPAGELRGSFTRTAATQTFTAPPAVPAINLNAITEVDAARFLTQATFGPTMAEIAALRQKGYNAWLDEQFALPATSQLAATNADYAAFPAGTFDDPPRANYVNRLAAWWKIAATAPDQLRQRVAFALSELFVISEKNDDINARQTALANYYDVLAHGAFGNFRRLLEDVTLNPMMGVYLTYRANRRSFRDAQGNVLNVPDENFAREIMQLFTIGLSRLQPDGALQLDAEGLPIPTYTQATVTETSKVFTGWDVHPAGSLNFGRPGNYTTDYHGPMALHPFLHDDTAKTIVGGQVLPANQGGAKDLTDTLDALFNHANTGPFISRQLIQRLVTSNPSPGYVYRVAQVFANNGSGTRGDLRAVIRAILIDYEARSAEIAALPAFGKLKEPMLRVTGLLRALNTMPVNTQSWQSFASVFASESLAQNSLQAATVFNFFEPDFVLPGPLAEAGLYAPEYQILTSSTAISVPNFISATLYNITTPGPAGIASFSGLPPLAEPVALVDQLNLLLCAGALPPAVRDQLASALTVRDPRLVELEWYRFAVYAISVLADAAIQK